MLKKSGRILCCIILMSCQMAGMAQHNNQLVSIKVLLPLVNVCDAGGLLLKVVVSNKSHNEVHVYKKLEEGHLLDEFSNFNLIIEKKEGKKFKVEKRGLL